MKNEMLEFALSLALAAEAEIMPRFRTCAVSWKADGSEVTEADRRAEAVIRELIAERYPAHGDLGEEYGGSQVPANDPLWVLDPIDGTASFAVGLPTFGTLIGYMENGEPQLGLIVDIRSYLFSSQVRRQCIAGCMLWHPQAPRR